MHRFWMLLGNLLWFSLRLDVLRNHTAISLCFKGSIHHFGVLLQSVIILFPNNMLSEPRVVWVLILLRVNKSLTIFGCLWEACGDFLFAWMFCGSVQRFCYAVRTKHSTFWSAIAVSHYFCFWTTCCQSIKDTLAKLENALLVDVYNCLCVQYIDILVATLRTKHTTFLSSTASCVHESFYLSLMTWHFQ